VAHSFCYFCIELRQGINGISRNLCGMKLEPSVLFHGVAGVGAGLAATSVLYPLEVIKIRLHVQGTLQAGRFAYRNSFHAFASILSMFDPWRCRDDQGF
jgi:hypothetical protein